MSDFLRDEIRALAESVQPPPSDVNQARRRGRRLRLFRAFVVGALLTVVAASGWVGAEQFLGEEVAERTVQPAASGFAQRQPVPNPRVASFAVRAVAHAGLLDPVGDFNDYQQVEPTGDGASWLVSFDAVTCEAATCEQNPVGDTQLGVELQDGVLVVTEATGPFGEEARQKLLNYQEQPVPEEPGLEFPVARLEMTPDEGLSVVASSVWRGPIPPSQIQVQCRVELYDRDGTLVYRGPFRDQPAPQGEQMRAGTLYVFGVPPGEVTGEAARAEVPCKTL